jgi:hypothetical protein
MWPCKSGQRSDRPCKKWILAWGLLGATGFLQAGCAAVPDRFSPAEPVDPASFSQAQWNAVLQAHVRDGLVDYPAMQRDQRFSGYLSMLDRVDPGSLPTEEARLAFWINAYNAFAIQGILDGERPAPYVGWYRYFKLRRYGVGGQRITLSDLEHGVLRKQFREPRIHFTIVCASSSCPKLQPWAFEPDRLEAQLDQAARDFINDPRRNRFDRRAKIAYLSKIFDWFEDDFSAAAGDVLHYVARYVNDPDVARDVAAARYRIEYLEYDWSLNGIPPTEASHADPS